MGVGYDVPNLSLAAALLMLRRSATLWLPSTPLPAVEAPPGDGDDREDCCCCFCCCCCCCDDDCNDDDCNDDDDDDDDDDEVDEAMPPKRAAASFCFSVRTAGVAPPSELS